MKVYLTSSYDEAEHDDMGRRDRRETALGVGCVFGTIEAAKTFCEACARDEWSNRHADAEDGPPDFPGLDWSRISATYSEAELGVPHEFSVWFSVCEREVK